MASDVALSTSLGDVRDYLTQAINMALDISGETTYTNSFAISVDKSGFTFIPRVPCSYVLNQELYDRIYEIASGVMYPAFTLLKQSGTYFADLHTDDIHVARGLRFPWFEGIPRRLKIGNIDQFCKSLASRSEEQPLPLMRNLIVDFAKVTHVAIAGNSGSGKSYALVYLLNAMHEFADITIVDPKFDIPSKWGFAHDVPVIKPENNRSGNDFVTQINDLLSDSLKTIQTRQKQLFDNSATEKDFRPKVIVIDELLALTMSVAKTVRDTFFGLLGQVALMGRSTRIHLVLVSQRFDAQSLPVAVREQVNLAIQLGNINRRSTQFLFPDLDSVGGIVIPAGKGTGLVQVIDGVHAANIMPLLMPTYKTSM